jgi:hypothetical protein
MAGRIAGKDQQPRLEGRRDIVLATLPLRLGRAAAGFLCQLGWQLAAGLKRPRRGSPLRHEAVRDWIAAG